LEKKKYHNVDFVLVMFAATIMASIVYYLNSNHGYMQASMAALKQALYTLLVGGLILKVLESIIKKINHKVYSIVWGVILSSALTTVLVFIVHSMKGTPEPILSTIPTLVTAPPGLLIVAMKKRFIDHPLKEAS